MLRTFFSYSLFDGFISHSVTVQFIPDIIIRNISYFSYFWPQYSNDCHKLDQNNNFLSFSKGQTDVLESWIDLFKFWETVSKGQQILTSGFRSIALLNLLMHMTHCSAGPSHSMFCCLSNSEDVKVSKAESHFFRHEWLTRDFSSRRVIITIVQVFCSHTILQKSARVSGRGPCVAM